MYLEYDENKLTEVFRTFHTLTGLRMMLFDTEYNKVLDYPRSDCSFCAMIKSSEKGMEKCLESDLNSFKETEKTGNLSVYHCHAGLIEATMPLKENGKVTGYLMFGQVTDSKDKSELLQKIEKLCSEYDLDTASVSSEAKNIIYQSSDNIQAAAKLLEMCTSYIILQELVIPESDRLISQLNEYIDAHLADDLHISNICTALAVSRTKLYSLFSAGGNGGIATYIKSKRIAKAKMLLRTTSMPISEISETVGFLDYNYFCRVFRNETGRSPKTYRRIRQNKKGNP